MKHLRNWKIFEDVQDDEDEDPDDKIRTGYKLSWNHIKERMVYLTDIGFELIDGTKKEYFIDNNGNKNVPLKSAEYSVIEFSMKKKVDENSVVSRKFGHLLRWNDSILEIHEEVASFCKHFDGFECYYNLKIDYSTNFGDRSDDDSLSWIVSFIIYSDVEEEVKTKENEKQLDYKIKEYISNSISRSRDNIINSLTPLVRNKVVENKLGESMYNFTGGQYVDGFLILPMNLTKISKASVKSNMPRLEDGIDLIERATGRNGKVELREINKDDLEKTSKLSGRDIKYLEDRYLGLLGYVITYDYKELYDKRKEYISI